MKSLFTSLILFCVILAVTIMGVRINSLAQENSRTKILRNLQEIQIKDTNKILSDDEKMEFIRLITKAYIDSVRQKQDNYLHTNIPLYILLRSNFPELKEREKETGISLEDIVKYFNSKPAYRELINSVLKEQKQRNCTQ